MKHELCMEECLFGAVTVGERGQIVIPVEARKRLSIQAGDRVLVLQHPSGDMLMLAKMDSMREFFSSFLEHLTKVEQKLGDSVPKGRMTKSRRKR